MANIEVEGLSGGILGARVRLTKKDKEPLVLCRFDFTSDDTWQKLVDFFSDEINNTYKQKKKSIFEQDFSEIKAKPTKKYVLSPSKKQKVSFYAKGKDGKTHKISFEANFTKKVNKK